MIEVSLRNPSGDGDDTGTQRATEIARSITRQEGEMRWNDWTRWALAVLLVAGSVDRRASARDLNPAAYNDSDTIPVSLPPVQPVNTRILELEARLAELEAKVNEKAADEKKKDDGYAVGSDLGMTAKWNNGLDVQSKNKDFRIHVGGRTQIDTSMYSGSGNVENAVVDGGVGPLMDATNLRRGRLRVDGVCYEVIEFACEYDFVNENNVDPLTGTSLNPPQTNPIAVPAVTDLWVQINQLPVVGNCRIGVQKDPFGFEHTTSSRYLNFMERSFAQDLFEGPFNNGFLPGISFQNLVCNNQIWWSVGEFKNTNNIFSNGVGDGEYETAGRLVWLPIFKDEGRYLLHCGVAGTHKELDEDQIRFRARGDIRSGAPSSLNPVFINTGNIAGNNEEQLGLELVSVWGPWSIASEYFGTWVTDATALNAANAGNAGFGLQPVPGTSLGTYYAQSGYVEVLYFLTGEHRAYDLKRAAFDRVVPNENFYFVRGNNGNCLGWGAWQAGFRYQRADLNDSGMNGGILNAYTFGLNWFWNPNFKVQFNYDLTQRDFVNILGANGSGNIHSFGTRVAFDF